MGALGFWVHGEELYSSEVEPVLASWMKRTHPDHIRLEAYRRKVIPCLSPLPAGSRQLFLHMEVGVSDGRKLLVHHDLENYLTPLFAARWLDSSRFALVTATKRIGGTSRIAVGYAGDPVIEDMGGWYSFTTMLDGGFGKKSRKIGLRDELAASTQPLSTGPVEVRLAWRCSSKRNWVSLWKPTGDTMGPFLGTSRNTGFNPQDDRIV